MELRYIIAQLNLIFVASCCWGATMPNTNGDASAKNYAVGWFQLETLEVIVNLMMLCLKSAYYTMYMCIYIVDV